jgi:hypothetical protein
VAEDDTQDVRAAAAAFSSYDRCAKSEIDLGLFAGAALETAEGQRGGLLETADEAADAVVTAGVAMLRGEVLEDALG